jgi:glycosyltransferase involved in cell wall biosynthesis
MKALLLSRYNRLGSSSRVRLFQYLGMLREAGWDVDVSPLLDDDYIERLYQGKRQNIGKVVNSYASRMLALLGAGSYDLIWIEREVFPWMPGILERATLPDGIPYVLDLDDAVFHRYDMHAWPVVRAVFGTKIDRLMRGSAAVIVGNDYLRDRALAAGSSHVELLPTVVDLAKYRSGERADRACPVIGWVGSPATQSFLTAISPALVELRKEHEFKVVLVGTNGTALSALSHETVLWSEDTEVESIRTLDIGIMPLPDSAFARGKCGYKLIQYMACGLPVVASPVGVNSMLVDHGRNGYLADTTEEWVESLGALLSSRRLRGEMGVQGRRLVERQYSLEVAGPELLRILTAACSL